MASTSCGVTKKHSRNLCSFTGCRRSKALYPTLHFFTFPVKRPSICDAWIKNCANEALDTVTEKTLGNRVVCEKHFEDTCFLNTLKTRLHACAVPTILSLQEMNDAPSAGDAHMLVAQEPNPVQTPSDNIHHEPVNPLQTPQSNISQLPHVDGKQAGCEAHSRRALFSTPSTSNTEQTPQYKKFKSVKGRKQTPKKILTPGKKILLTKLNSSRKLKRNYHQKVKRLQNKRTAITKEMVISAVQNMLPANVSNFVCMQLKHVDKKKMPWTEEEKLQALAMRYKSPALYDQMRSDGFALPSTSTIARWLQVIDLRPGVCSEIIGMIKNKVQHMGDWEKNAVLLFDEMSIKSSLDYDSKRDVIEGLFDLGEDGKPYPATHVLLFMARGLTYRWKMPIAYFATNKMVNGSVVAKLIPKCINAVQNAGLKVRAVVCDQSSVNRKAATLLNTSAEAPFFEIDGRKIYFVYDFPHVIKCIRNNLMKRKNGCFVGQMTFSKTPTNVTQEETVNPDDEQQAAASRESSEELSIGVADWANVQMLYNIDSQAAKSRATKLTEKHIRPNTF